MKIMVGDTRSRKNIALLKAWGWGRMFATRPATPYEFEPWGFDNGAYVAWTRGESFPADQFLRRLDAAEKVNSDPIIAVVPDIVAGGRNSLEFSLGWRLQLRNSWPWYLAVQDGMSTAEVSEVLHFFCGIFLGGTDKFKLTAQRWSDLAHGCGRKFHYGRAGTLRKLQHAHAVEADSCDSNFPLWTCERMDMFKRHDEAIRSKEQCELTFTS
jgi:hypothetical protein